MAHVGEFHRWTTALNVKLLLPPRQSRGASLGRLVIEAHEIEVIGERLRRALDDVLTELKGEGALQ